MEVLHYAGSKRCCLDWQPYSAYAINRRDFRDLRKCTVTFYCNWICQNAEFVSSFGPETEEKINRRKTKFPLICSFQKVIKALAFSVVKNSAIQFMSKFMISFDSQLHKL